MREADPPVPAIGQITEGMSVLYAGAEPVDGFRLQSRLGAGAFGEVWEALNAKRESVALKFIDSRKKESCLLRGEVRILRALNEIGHPNIIRLLAVYASSHYLVLCMERADGNLEELRQTYRTMADRNIAPDHLLDLLEQAAQGLDCIARLRLPGFNMASIGLQHCDVKPSNLLLMGDSVRIADFGLCAALGQQTHRNGWRGTLPYAAPELYYGRASSATDQFSLAVTYCDLVAGDRMLLPDVGDGPGVRVDMAAVRARERPVLARALSSDPTRRWSSCTEFIRELREVALPASGAKRIAVRPALVRRGSPA